MSNHSLKSIVFVAANALALLWHGVAAANSSDDDRVLRLVAALEARVSALEKQNQEYRHDAETARTQARAANEKLVRLSNAAMPPSRVVTKQPNQPILVTQPEVWSGAYWGASAGGAATSARTYSLERYAALSPTNQPPFNLIGYDIAGRSGPGHGAGA